MLYSSIWVEYINAAWLPILCVIHIHHPALSRTISTADAKIGIYTLSKARALVYIIRVEERRAEPHRLNHHHKPSLVHRKPERNRNQLNKWHNTPCKTPSTPVYYRSGGGFTSHQSQQSNGFFGTQPGSTPGNTKGIRAIWSDSNHRLGSWRK